MNKSFAAMFEESQKSLKMFPGAIIKAKVIDINEEFIGVDIDNYNFVQGNSLDSLENGRYFLKINKY